MADLGNFNANDVEPTTDFEPIPAGKYLAVITDSEMKRTKAGTGHYLQLAFQIIEGPYKNRFLWARLNLDNPNATAVQIARGTSQLRKVRLFGSVRQIAGSSDVTGRPCQCVQHVAAQSDGPRRPANYPESFPQTFIIKITVKCGV